MSDQGQACQDGAAESITVGTPGPAAERSPRIVVGVDGSPHSVHALTQAAQLAEALDGSLHAVLAWQFPSSGIEYFPPDWSPEGEAVDTLRAAAATVFGGPAPEWFRGTVYQGWARKALIDLSEHADLLIVGSRGHGGFAGLLLGSVSGAVAQHSKCPVLVMQGGKLIGLGSPVDTA